jgi:hypothetical protein
MESGNGANVANTSGWSGGLSVPVGSTSTGSDGAVGST